jgi:hypothetical protein
VRPADLGDHARVRGAIDVALDYVTGAAGLDAWAAQALVQVAG